MCTMIVVEIFCLPVVARTDRSILMAAGNVYYHLHLFVVN